jgi:hypothetical protein
MNQPSPGQSWPGDLTFRHRKVLLLVLVILVLTVQWALSFFGRSIVPGIPHTGGFIYMLSFVIITLILIRVVS